MRQECPMQRVACTETTMEESPPRSVETGSWIKSPNSPDFPAPISWPLDGTYDALGDPIPKQ